MDTQFYYKKIIGEFSDEFETLRNFLGDNNKKFNLTSITDKNEVYIKHFLDSVVGEKYFPIDAKVVEIGSGGGFPSLPLKIIRKDLNFLLVESTGKKCGYLKEAVDKLRLNCVQVLNSRAEDAAREVIYREKFDVSVARAVARLNTLAEYCLPFVKIGGRFIAYKGDCDDEISEALKAFCVLGGEIENIEKFELPDCGRRTLIIVKKVKPTPPLYPRGQGREKKCPIV